MLAGEGNVAKHILALCDNTLIGICLLQLTVLEKVFLSLICFLYCNSYIKVKNYGYEMFQQIVFHASKIICVFFFFCTAV